MNPNKVGGMTPLVPNRKVLDPVIEIARLRASMTGDKSGGGDEDIGHPETQDTQEPHRSPCSPKISTVSADADSLSREMPQSQTTTPPEDFAHKACRELIALPFNNFLCQLYQQRDSLGETFEGGELFHFIRYLRSHRDMARYADNPKGALDAFEKHLRGWTRTRVQQRQAPPFGHNGNDCWQDWFGIDKNEARAAFLDSWEKVRYQPGQGPIEQAIDRARRTRLHPPKHVMDKRPPEDPGDLKTYTFFLSVAGHLQVVMGDKTVFLPCRKFGTALGVTRTTISRWRRWAAEDGYLSVVSAHKFRADERSDSTGFRFAVERFDCLKERAQRP